MGRLSAHRKLPIMVPPAKENKNVNKLSGTDLIHGDDGLHGPEVAPSVSVSTSTFGNECAYVTES